MYCVAPEPENGLLFEYRDPVVVERAFSPAEASALMARVSARAVSERLYAVGYVSYEAAPGFDQAFCGGKASRTGTDETAGAEKEGAPFACFALYSERSLRTGTPEGSPCDTSAFVPEMDKESYRRAIGDIKGYLRRGESYQINMTFRLRARYYGDTLAWFLARAAAEHGRYTVFLRDGTRSIASFSPELFFALSAPDGDDAGIREIVLKPMKGTARLENGRNDETEARLKADPKNRAENLMITDMIRNDVGKIAIPGTVEVRDLFGTETFPTVVQMTSTVAAKTRASLSDAFGALFPCASITGAPKVGSMRIIDELEPSPRGPYTGAIGVVRPDGSAWFSVAIRTAVFDGRDQSVEYGAGGGIVWGSVDIDEWEECMLKAKIVTDEVDNGSFCVFESLLLENGSYFLRERHLERLEKSLSYFGFPRFFSVDSADRPTPIPERVRDSLNEIARANATGSIKVRVSVSASGAIDAVAEPLTPLPSPYRIVLATDHVDSANPFLRHKTSVRGPIERSLRRLADGESRIADDVVMINERGELTESSRANIVLEMGGVKYTPPVDSGILPGVFRDELLASGSIRERTLYPRDFAGCERVYIINSVRRFVECVRVVR